MTLKIYSQMLIHQCSGALATVPTTMGIHQPEYNNNGDTTTGIQQWEYNTRTTIPGPWQRTATTGLQQRDYKMRPSRLVVSICHSVYPCYDRLNPCFFIAALFWRPSPLVRVSSHWALLLWQTGWNVAPHLTMRFGGSPLQWSQDRPGVRTTLKAARDCFPSKLFEASRISYRRVWPMVIRVTETSRFHNAGSDFKGQ